MSHVTQEDKDALCERGYALFRSFYRAAAPLRDRYYENEQFYKGNHWHNRPPRDPGDPQPVTPLMFSTVESVLADFMDYYPQPLIAGEEPKDDAVAEDLTHLVRYVLNRRHYRATYRDKCRQALKIGTSVQQVFWDGRLMGGLGDVNIRKIDTRSFLFDPYCADIQDGRACFVYGFYSREYLAARYGEQAMRDMRQDFIEAVNDISLFPDMKNANYLRGGGEELILLIEYYYKTFDPNGRAQVNMARFAGGKLLEHGEDLYAHGGYPFIVEPLYPLEGEAAGVGVIDMFKDLQQHTDKLDQLMMRNALISGKVKLLVNKSAGLDGAALRDWDSEVVEGNNVSRDAVQWFQANTLPPFMMEYMQNKMELIKSESGQSDWLRGETTRGVTAASAIAALQEAGSKRSRVLIDMLYDGYERLIRMLIATIAQHYTERRTVRVLGDNSRLVRMDGSRLRRGAKDGSGCLEFDIRVSAEKIPPTEAIYNNDFALRLLESGAIGPADAVGMMSFTGKNRALGNLTPGAGSKSAGPADKKESEEGSKSHAKNGR